MSEQPLYAFTQTDRGRPSRRRLIVAGGGLCGLAAILVVGFFVWRWLRPSPYGEMVGRLHPGMHDGAVFDVLGKPYASRQCLGPPAEGGTCYLDALYRVHGTDRPLIISSLNSPLPIPDS